MAIHDDALAILRWLDRRPPGPLTRAARDRLRPKLDSLLWECATSWDSLTNDDRDGCSDICEALGFEVKTYLYHSAIARTQRATYAAPWRAEYVAKRGFRKRIQSALRLLCLTSTPPSAKAPRGKSRKAGAPDKFTPRQKAFYDAVQVHRGRRDWIDLVRRDLATAKGMLSDKRFWNLYREVKDKLPKVREKYCAEFGCTMKIALKEMPDLPPLPRERRKA